MASHQTILIAEDDERLLKALTVRLEAAGYKVIGARDGYQALECCRRHKPDLLLMDINMPAGSGLSVQERMGKIDEVATIPVVYITGDWSEDVLEKAEALGAVGVVHKPVSPGELLAVVENVLDSGSNKGRDAA